MLLLRDLRELRTGGKPVCAALGMFDGVHLGHQHIVAGTVAAALACRGLSLVVTFDRHPATVVAPERAPQLLQPLSARLAALEALHPDALWLIHFDEAFSLKPGEEFIRELARGVATLRRIGVGENFRFGHTRSGDVALLRRLSAELGFDFSSSAPIQATGEPVSSTRIRDLVRRGEFASAALLLGRPYELVGPVVHGDHLGRQLGFPTANLDAAGLVVPPHGVYATRAALDGREVPSVTNIGMRPTLREARPSLHVETYLFDRDEDLYGKALALRFVAKLRDEQRFGSLEELRTQIQRDAAEARRVLSQG